MIEPDDIYDAGGIIVECMEEDVENGIKQLHYAVKLQELVKERYAGLMDIPNTENNKIAYVLQSLVKQSES